MLWLYNIGIKLYGLFIQLLSPFNLKAALFSRGRSDVFHELARKIDFRHPHLWFHFASLGEFEQGRPVLEKIKSLYPKKKVVITFFSPSGYEVKKNYSLAEGVFYLPLDSRSNARKFIKAINPEIAIFTKYEYWYYYFNELHQRKVPLFIISGIFRPNQIYFKWHGSFNRSILSFVDHFFIQNTESKQLLSSIGLHNSSISGDTRFDRVFENAKSPKLIEFVANFCGSSNVLVAGSTWEADELLLSSLIERHPRWKIIIAPHEIDNNRIDALQRLLPDSIKYSDRTSAKINSQVLIIDNIGLLSSLYQYGDIAYIGGGFGAGIHNTLEAAAFGLPVIFGPKYEKFQEAKDLISLGAAVSISGREELLSAFEQLNSNRKPAGDTARGYVEEKKGSTDQIVNYLQQYLRLKPFQPMQ
jgi:3-deoxy-D-manno-octulosonic-acid transferase